MEDTILATNSGKGRSTTRGAAASRKNTASKSKSGKKKTQRDLADIVSRNELVSTLIFAAGVLLLIVMLLAGTTGSLWNTVHTFYLAVFGITGYYIPLAILFIGVVKVMNVNKPVFVHKILQIFVLLFLIGGIIHINTFAKANPQLGFAESLKTIYEQIMDHTVSSYSNGGVAGALIGGLFFQLGRSVAVANIISIILVIADLMFLFGITLFKVFSGLEKPARKVGAYTEDAIETAKIDIEKKKKERTEERARRKAENNSDPTKVVDDFFKNNPDAETPEHTSSSQIKPKQQEKSRKKNETVQPFSGEVASIFDMAEKKEETPANVSESDPVPETSPDREPEKNIFDFTSLIKTKEKVGKTELSDTDDSKVVQLDGAPQKDAPVKADPLTNDEKETLNNEFDLALEAKPVAEYKKPPLECLKMPKVGEKNYDPAELKSNGEKLIAALNSFNVQATIVDVVPGPTVTRYELSPAPGVKISKFVGLSDDLALHMAAPAGLRIEAPIPNKAAIGIEIPNKNKVTVTFREVIDNDTFRGSKSKLNVALGKDIAGDIIYSDIAKMPHLLVAGTTGSGKSVCLNTMIMSILYNATPEEVKIILIDPKQVEFGIYNGLPHLLVPVVSDPRKASGALGWAVTEMLSRYKTLNANGVRDIVAYNSLCEEREDLVKMPQIVIFIDELSDLMTVAPAEVEDSIQRLAQMARAAGMHLVVATQRPSVDVITGVIKANIPSRIALTVKSQIDSRTIIDSAGAEKLMGYGDMLYYPVGVPKPIRVQGAYLSDKEIETVVEFVKANTTATYDDAVQQEIERQAAAEKKKGASAAEESDSSKLDKNDDLLMRAIELFVSAPEKASISALQRHLSLGFAKAGRLMDTLEEKGIVGPTEGSKPRKVLITKAQWYEMNAMSGEVTDGSIPSDDSTPDDFENI